MLNFQRNKLVSVTREDDDTLRIHGVLDDHIFGLELDVLVGLDDLKIHAIEGRWQRQETPECHRAVPFLQAAAGYAIDAPDFGRRINKLVGRKSCPHYANLLIECCDAAMEAVAVIRWQAARKERTALTLEQFLDDDISTAAVEKHARPVVTTVDDGADKPAAAPQTHQDTGDGFLMDLHIHTYPASPCSSVGVDPVIQQAQRIGLNAICLTDHNYVWPLHAIEDLTQKHGFLVLRGNEITTDQGDMLVFGMHEEIRGIIELTDLKQLVDEARAFMIAAHPFRGFLVFNTSQIGLTAEKAMARPAFHQVHAMEVLNGKVTAEENAFAREVAAGLGLPMTGGSDAHDLADIGKYATRFAEAIRTEADLLAALKNGAYTPCEPGKLRIRS